MVAVCSSDVLRPTYHDIDFEPCTSLWKVIPINNLVSYRNKIKSKYLGSDVALGQLSL